MTWKLQRQLCRALRIILSGQRAIIPEAGRDLMGFFFQLSEARTWHAAGPNPIGFADIAACCHLMRQPLEPRHVALIRALDAVWVEHFYHRRLMTKDHGVKTLPPVSGQPLTAALFDVTAG